MLTEVEAALLAKGFDTQYDSDGVLWAEHSSIEEEDGGYVVTNQHGKASDVLSSTERVVSEDAANILSEKCPHTVDK